MLRARGDRMTARGVESISKIRFSRLEAKFTTFSTGGTLLTTPDDPDPESTTFPRELGFDHMQSYFIGVEGRPTSNLRANVTVNILGNVADNPIDEIFYETRGRTTSINVENVDVDITNVNNVDILDAEFEWNAKDFLICAVSTEPVITIGGTKVISSVCTRKRITDAFWIFTMARSAALNLMEKESWTV